MLCSLFRYDFFIVHKTCFQNNLALVKKKKKKKKKNIKKKLTCNLGGWMGIAVLGLAKQFFLTMS